MPSLPISQLPELTAITMNSEFAVAESGTTYKVKGSFLGSGKNYISVYETSTISGFTINSPTPISASTVAESLGITISNGTRFVVSSGGTYNFQFSLQLVKTQGGSSEDIFLWFRINNNDVPWSNTKITLANNNDYTVAAWNFVTTLNTNDYIELICSVTDSNIILVSEPANTSPTRPGIPSVIISLTKI
jgi:hypothetical protein